MSHLKTLKVAFVGDRASNRERTLRARGKLTAALEEQKCIAEALLAGEHYAPTYWISAKDDAGLDVRVKVLKYIRKHWFTDIGGKTFFKVYFSGRCLQFEDGNNAIEVLELHELPSIIDVLIRAAQAGEFDSQFDDDPAT